MGPITSIDYKSNIIDKQYQSNKSTKWIREYSS